MKMSENIVLSSKRLPAATVNCALQLAGHDSGDAVVQPDLADFFPSRMVEILSAAPSGIGKEE
jgi:hypothetical protein